MNELPVRAARWSALHPWRAIIGWLMFVALCLGTGVAVGTNSATTEDYWIGEAGRAEAMATEGGLQREPTEQIMLSARSGTLDESGAAAAARDLTTRMSRLPEVKRVAPPLRDHQASADIGVGEPVGPEVRATVKTHLLRLFAKLDVNDRTHAVVVALERGLLRRTP